MNATPRPAPESDPMVQLCAFSVGVDQFVIDLMRIEEVLKPLPVTPVPRAASCVEGVIHLRGGIVPVVDLRERLGAPRSAPGPKARLLICLLGRRRVAFRVDAVWEAVRVRRSELAPPPPLLAAHREFVVGVLGAPNRLRLLLDLKALLRGASGAAQGGLG